MFSTITEAWSHDPVKEMTDKLSNRSFETNNNLQLNPERSENQIFIGNKNQNEMVVPKYDNSLNMSDINTISLMSDNSLIPSKKNIIYSPFAPAQFDKYDKFSRRKTSERKYLDTDSENSVSDYFHDKTQRYRCDFSIKHLKNCDRCYQKLKQLINDKMDKKFDEMMLDYKLKQIQNIPNQQTPTAQPFQQMQNSQNSNSWRETLMIVIMVILVILVIFLIIKVFQK